MIQILRKKQIIVAIAMIGLSVLSILSCKKKELEEVNTVETITSLEQAEALAFKKAEQGGYIQYSERDTSYRISTPGTIFPLSDSIQTFFTRSASLDPSNWMQNLNNDKSLSELSIPGTHESCARFGAPFGIGVCQDLSIYEQLKSGVRALDIRCRHLADGFFIHHDVLYQQITFGEVLAQIRQFLRENPSEFVVVSVKEEYNPAENTRSFDATFRDLYLKAYGDILYVNNGIPKVGDVRGKAVLFRRFSSSVDMGINASHSWADKNNSTISNNGYTIYVQDFYNVDNGLSLDWKWGKCKAHFDKALNDNSNNALYVNFLSGAGGALLPYNCAEGIIGYWGMNRQYEEFYFKQRASIHNNGKRIGIVMHDFIASSYHPLNTASLNFQ